jgi:oligogalacturonide transport system permease protein
MNVMKIKNLQRHSILILLSLVMMYPIFWWISAAFKSNEEMSSPGLIPANASFINFIEGWNAVPGYTFTHFYTNTFMLIAGVLFTTIISCSLVAFGFSRLDFPLRSFWFSIVLVTVMLPNQITLVPQYAMFNGFGWVNTYLPFIVPHSLAGGIGGSFFIFLLVQFIRGIPSELDEAAKMDGCSWFGIYFRIIMPLLKPPLVTVAIYCFLWNWDDFLGHLIYINAVDKYTVGLALRMMIDTSSTAPWGQLFAMSLVSVLPSVFIFFLAQRHIVEGVATSGLKG